MPTWLTEMTTYAASAVAKGEAFGPIEFWFNRYQTFVGAMIALAAAAYAVRAQSRQRFYEFLRMRSQQLQHELTLLQTMTSSVEIALAVPVRISHMVGNAADYWPAERGEMEASEQYMTNAISSFRDDIGPAWGSVVTQKIRQNCLDLCFQTSSRYDRLLREFQLGAPVTSPALLDALQDFVPLSAQVTESANQFWAAIRDENERIAPLIAKLESKLLV